MSDANRHDSQTEGDARRRKALRNDQILTDHINKISARLAEIADILAVPISAFYDDVGNAPHVEQNVIDNHNERELLNYYRSLDRRNQIAIIRLAQLLKVSGRK